MEVDKQQLALNKMLSGEDIFLTGLGGAGKSYTIEQFMKKRYRTTALCSPTGIGAVNVGGTTCHKMFGLPIGIPTEAEINTVNSNMKKLFGSGSIKSIIIDEIGILRADMLDIIDRKLRIATGKAKKFGGIQMMGVGDFYQLEPIRTNKEKKYFDKNYPSPFCFDSHCWDFETIELTKSYRQDKKEQVDVLNSIRTKDENFERALEYISDNAKPYTLDDPILHLSCYKKDAAIINDLWYKRLNARSKTYKAEKTGKWNQTPVDEELSLKVGCRVLIRANNTMNGYVNGDKGVVLAFEPEGVHVQLDTGVEVFVEPCKWETFKYTTSDHGLNKEVDNTFKQIPLSLGYAITVHNAQGLTLDNVALDFGDGCFSHGQAYVALSRIRDLTNIRLVDNIYPSDIICKDRVRKFYRGEL